MQQRCDGVGLPAVAIDTPPAKTAFSAVPARGARRRACALYLAGAEGAAVEAGGPVLPVAPDPRVLLAVAAAAGTGRARAIVASREVDAHAVVPAGVRLQLALVHV